MTKASAISPYLENSSVRESSVVLKERSRHYEHPVSLLLTISLFALLYSLRSLGAEFLSFALDTLMLRPSYSYASSTASYFTVPSIAMALFMASSLAKVTKPKPLHLLSL